MEILIFNVLMDHENKVAGDEDPIRAWKGHNWDYRLMYRKIDIMESKMGIQFYPPSLVDSGGSILGAQRLVPGKGGMLLRLNMVALAAVQGVCFSIFIP